jgi:hypothetical protein
LTGSGRKNRSGKCEWVSRRLLQRGGKKTEEQKDSECFVPTFHGGEMPPPEVMGFHDRFLLLFLGSGFLLDRFSAAGIPEGAFINLSSFCTRISFAHLDTPPYCASLVKQMGNLDRVV